MVGDGGGFFGCWPRAQNSQIAIELQRVSIDDFPANELGQPQRERGLTACSGASYENAMRLQPNPLIPLFARWSGLIGSPS